VSFAMDQDRFAAHEARMDSVGAEIDRDEPYEGDEPLPRPARLERFYDEATGAWWTRPARDPA
jgi:hypothetical protein